MYTYYYKYLLFQITLLELARMRSGHEGLQINIFFLSISVLTKTILHLHFVL